jgi:hypothetical protein
MNADYPVLHRHPVDTIGELRNELPGPLRRDLGLHAAPDPTHARDVHEPSRRCCRLSAMGDQNSARLVSVART